MVLNPIQGKIAKLQTQAEPQQAARPQFCALSIKLLFNRLAGRYFNSHIGSNLASKIDQFFTHLPDLLKQRADQIDQMDRTHVLQAARDKILDFIAEKGKKYSIPENLNEENPRLIEDFFKQSPSGEYDLGQLCGELSWAMTGTLNEKAIRYFENVYYVLRAAELLAGPVAAPHIVNPILPSEIPQTERDSDYQPLDGNMRSQLRGLLSFAFRSMKDWQKSIRSILLETKFPEKIRKAIRTAATEVEVMESISDEDFRFFENIKLDAQKKQEGEKKEILQRTLGEVLSILDPWIKGEEGTMPDLSKLTSSLRSALIYYKFIIESTE